MAKWISIKDKLPPLDQIVMVCMKTSSGRIEYAWGGRVDDSEGWMWGLLDCFNSRVDVDPKSKFNDIEVDDDYPIKFWKPLDAPPEFED